MRKILTYIVAAATILFPIYSMAEIQDYGSHDSGATDATGSDNRGQLAAKINKNGEAINANGKILDQVSGDVAILKDKFSTTENNARLASEKSQEAWNKADSAEKLANSFEKRVSANEGKLTSQQNELSDHEKRITNNTTDISTNKNNIATNAANIKTNKENIWKNEQSIIKETNERILGDKRTLQESKAYTDSKFGELKDMVEKNRKETFAGVAAALAASQVPQVTQGSAFSIGAGVGSYQGQTAVAIGMSFRFADDIITKLTVTGDTQQRVGVGAGYAVEW